MIDDVSILRITIGVSHLDRPNDRVELKDVMVDTGSEYTWVPRSILEGLGVRPRRVQRFETADKRVLTRDIGYAEVAVAGLEGPTVVVFGEPDDMTLLGAVTLEELALRVDLGLRALVPAGPLPVAAAA